MFRTYNKKNLILFGSVQLLFNKGFAATSSRVTSAICWARLGFPGACRFSTLAQVVLLISSLLLAMTAAGHGIHCRVSMHPLLVVEFYAGYVRWCQFTPAMGCHTQCAGIPANGTLALLPHEPTCVWNRCALFVPFLMWQFVTNMSCN